MASIGSTASGGEWTMPPPSRPFFYRAWESSNNQLAYCVRYYANNEGFAVCDLRNPDNGTIIDRAYVCENAGAINAPSEAWDKKTIDPEKHPLVMFSVTPEIQGGCIVTGLAYARLRYYAPDQDTDTSDAPTVRDEVWANGGSRMTIKEDGKIYVRAGKTLTIVLEPGAELRVMDDNGDENAALAGPTYENDQELANRLAALETWAAALATEISGIPKPPVVPFPVTSPLIFDPAKLQSAVLALSSKNKGLLP